MSKKRKIWFISWAVIIVIIGIFGGLASAFFPLILLGFIELIRLFIFSVKRGKTKMEELKVQQEKTQAEIREQKAAMEKSNLNTELDSENIQASNIQQTKTYNEAVWKKFVITVIAILPTRLITDPVFLAFANMDTPTMLSKWFGFRLYKCRYCGRYFSSINRTCKKSPTGNHME